MSPPGQHAGENAENAAPKGGGTSSLLKHWPIFAVKFGLSGLLLWYVMGKVDLDGALKQLPSLHLSACVVVLGLLMAQLAGAGMRLRGVLILMGFERPLLQMIRISFVGYFFSQTLVSFVSGDGMRIWQLVRDNVPINEAAHGVFLERTIGLASQLILVSLSLPFVLALAENQTQTWSLLLMTMAGVAMLIMLFTIKFMPERWRNWRPARIFVDLSMNVNRVFRDRRWAVPMLGYSFGINFLNLLVIYAFAQGLNVDISLWHVLILSPAVLLLSMLPISFAGWGVREGAMVVAFGFVGVPPDQSLLVSLLFGLSVLAISLPGSILWFRTRQEEDIDKSAEARPMY